MERARRELTSVAASGCRCRPATPAVRPRARSTAEATRIGAEGRPEALGSIDRPKVLTGIPLANSPILPRQALQSETA